MPASVLPLVLLLAIGVETADVDEIRMVAVSGEGEDYWPGWRGPSGQGLAKGGEYPDRWSDTENVLWRVEVPGRGNSSPIVWGDRIFLTTAYDDGHRLSLLSYRRSDGKPLWETSIPQDGIEPAHGKNGHASATPVTDGTYVYVSFGARGLFAFDFDGRIIWHRKVGSIDNYHGSAGSPVLYKDTVILYQDHRGPSFVAAFDKKTGKKKWRTARSASVGWGSPIVVRTPTRDELIVSSQQVVSAYDPETGRLLWTATGNRFEVIPTPTVGQGLIFCSSGRSGSTLAIRPGGMGDVTETHVAWKSSKGAPFVPSTIVVGDQLYMVNDMQSVVTSFEAKTGQLLFQGRLGPSRREGFSASPVAVGDKIFFTNDNGETFVLAAGPTFQLLRVNRLNAQTLASPALVDGHWYFRTESELIAIGD